MWFRHRLERVAFPLFIFTCTKTVVVPLLPGASGPHYPYGGLSKVLIGPSRYWHESPICDKLKHQIRYLKCSWLTENSFKEKYGIWLQKKKKCKLSCIKSIPLTSLSLTFVTTESLPFRFNQKIVQRQHKCHCSITPGNLLRLHKTKLKSLFNRQNFILFYISSLDRLIVPNSYSQWYN